MSTTAQNQNIIGTLASFVRDNSYKQVSKIKMNGNGYPFVSFLTASGEWSHIYLSKRLGETVSEGQEPKVLKGCIVSRCLNAAKEERIKICSPAENGMIEVSADMF